MSVYENISRELLSLNQDVVSSKVLDRNRSIDRLNELLTSNKDEIFYIMSDSKYNSNLTWSFLYNGSIDSILQHSLKLDSNAKGYQTSVNKNHLYSSVLKKIIENSYECKKSKKISTNVLYQGILTLMKNRIVREHFGTTILQIIEETFFSKNKAILCDLKMNDYTELIISIFDIAKKNEQNLNVGLKCAVKGIEYGVQCFQCIQSLFEILEYIQKFTHKVENNEAVFYSVIKLNLLVLNELAIEGHQKVVHYYKDTIEIFCRFYNPRLRSETKEILFQIFELFFDINFPNIQNEINFPNNTRCSMDWEKMNRKLFYIIEAEIKEKYSTINIVEERSESFIKFAAKMIKVIYTTKNIQVNDSQNVDGECSSAKHTKISTSLEDILDIINKNRRLYNQPIWFTILVKFLKWEHTLIDITSLQLLLNIIIEFSSQNFDLLIDIQSVKILTKLLLTKEIHFVEVGMFEQLWEKFVIFILNELAHSDAILAIEIQNLLQLLIKYKKVNLITCTNIVKSLMETNKLNNINNLKTIREMLIVHGTSVVIKNGLEEFFKQLYSSNNESSDSQFLLYLGHITIILILNNFENFDKHIINDTFENNRNTIIEENSNIIQNLHLKYIRKFVAIESRKTEIIKTKLKITSVTYLNEKYFEYLLKNSDFQLNENAKLIENLYKLKKLIMLIANFSKFNIFGSATEACLLRKKFGLLIQRICVQLKKYSQDNILRLECIKISFLTKDTLQVLVQLKENNLFEYSDQYIETFTTFLHKIFECLNTRNLDWEVEIKDEIKVNILKALATMSQFNGFKKNTFDILKEYDFTETNRNKTNNLENIDIFFDVLHHLIRRNEFLEEEIPNWILENLEIICRKHHNNLDISTKIIDTLLNICISFKNFADNISDIFVILSSFLKICYKSKFNSIFNAKVILLFKDIAKMYPDLILNNEDIRELYTSSIGKFFSFTSLIVKFSVVECVSYLLDATWLSEFSPISEEYIEFSKKLYNSINWISLLNNDNDDGMNSDERLNTNSGIIQLFFALFGFSYINGQSGFLELVDFCKNNKLNENFFAKQHINQFAKYFNCEFESLVSDSSKKLISFWLKQNFELNEIPWFLCSAKEDTFYKTNLIEFIFIALKNNKKYILELENKTNTKKDIFLKQNLEKSYAFVLPYSLNVITADSDYVLINRDYIQEVNNLLENYKSYKINLTAMLKSLELYDVIFHLLSQYSDNKKFQELINCKTHFSNIEDFDFHILQGTLNNLTGKIIKFSNFALSNSCTIVKLNEKLKWKIFNSKFTTEKLLWVCRYITIIDLLDIKDIEDDLKWFFANDVIYFTSSILKNFSNIFYIFKAIIYFIEKFLKKLISWSNQLENGIFEIINQIIEIAESNNEIEEKLKICLSFLENVFCWIIESKNELLSRLEPLMEKEIFMGTSIEIHSKKLPSVTRKTISEDLDEFINSKTKTSYIISKLSLNITKKKKEFKELTENIEKKEYTSRLLNILIDIIMNNSEKEAKCALECLGAIGPIFTSKYAFLNESSNSIFAQNCDDFEKRTVQGIEKIIFIYNPTSYGFTLEVADFIANSKKFELHIKNQKFLKPFLRNKDLRKSYEIEYTLKTEINLINLLRENSNQQYYEIFLKSFTSKIFKSVNLVEFEKLSSESFEFCEFIILPLIAILLQNSQGFHTVLIDMLEHFYTQTNDVILSTNCSNRNYINKRTIKLMLDITELYRIQNNFNISINLLNAANVAAYQQAYFLAILYLELWALNQKNNPSSSVTNSELLQNPIFQKIALPIFKAIDCKDAINGFLDPIDSQIELYNNNNDWMDILIENDASNSLQNSKFLIDILKRNGLLSLSTILQNSANLAEDEIDYEIYWRLGNWDIPVSDNGLKINENNLENLENQFEKNHYAALKAIKEKDETNTIRSVEAAKSIIIKILKESSVESVQNFYKHLTNLMLLRQIEEFSVIQFSSTGKCLTNSETILLNWDLECDMKYGNFGNKERIIAQKIALYELSGTRAQRKISEYHNGSNIIALYLINMVENCYNYNLNENFCLAKRYLSKLKSLADIDEKVKIEYSKIEIINAEISKKTGRKSTAFAILQNKIKESPTQHSILYQIDARRLLGCYLADDNDEPFNEIYGKYFCKAQTKLEKLQEMIDKGTLFLDMKNYNRIKKKLYHNIAEYANREFQQVEQHIKSENFQKSIEIMEKHRNDAETIKKNIIEHKIDPTAADFKAKNECYTMLNRNAKIDANYIEYFQNSRNKYLELALKNYIEYCKMDDTIQSSVIYRIINLWFSNKSNEDICEIIKNSEIPNYKFLCVLSQLTAQLNSNENKFIEVLTKIIIKCALEHPYHTLNHIMCLYTANEDLQYFGHKSNTNNNNDLRWQRIKKILDSLKKDKTCSEIIKQTHQAFINLIECAYWNMQDPNLPKTIQDYSLSHKLQKMKNLDHVHCPTVNLEIRPVVNEISNYEIVSIRGWDSKYEPVGGINAPKKIFCNCSDGVKRPQLLKGNDDLRQDSIMLHVLKFVNDLLIQSKDNSDLSIRTYKVIPLSKRSGLLEWCTDTTTLSYYLCGKNRTSGAHAKYRPEDKSPHECRAILMKYRQEKPEKRVKIFQEVCKKIQPVLHYFFFEKFKIPGLWFERRLAYMNSVATTSMIGYILGLGDRHCQNILLDEKTAEVIHIDFGIAFEKGKVMPTPETVPFRLTREIISPMGICDVNGIFKNSCERTLQILRDNQQVLLTILEVLLYDPLYCWSLNEKITKRINEDNNECDEIKDLRENSEDNVENSTAHRALMRIQSKLEGRNDKQIGSFSVCTQVEKLIAEARNEVNLALLFPGWDPIL